MSKAPRRKAGVKTASSSDAAGFFSGSEGLITFSTLDTTCNIKETQDIISIKKLDKKDSSSREKALRELIVRTSEENEDAVYSVFSNIAGIMDRLTLDCEPGVRSLTLRLVGKQMAVLKKKAAKELKLVLPWMIFGTCDSYPPAATEAQNALETLFPGEKYNHAVKLVLDQLLSLIRQIVLTKEFTLLAPQRLLRNNKEEDENERKNRLIEQSLTVLSRLSTLMPSYKLDKVIKECVLSEKRKEGNSPLSRGILRALLSSSCTSSIISESSLENSLVASLSTPLAENAVMAADALVVLLQQRPFSSKLVEKKIISFVSAMKGEWPYLWSRVLPLLASLSNSSEAEERSRVVCAFLSATTSSRPSSSSSFSAWADAVIESVKFVLAVLKDVSAEEREAALSAIHTVLDASTSESREEQKRVAIAILPWLFFPDRLPSQDSNSFIATFFNNISGRLPKSADLLEVLLCLHIEELRCLWSMAEVLPDGAPLHLLSSSSDSFLVNLHSEMDLLSRILHPTQSLQAERTTELASVACRLLSALPSLPPSFSLPPNDLSAEIVSRCVEEGRDAEWQTLSPILEENSAVDTLRFILSSWSRENGKGARKAARLFIRFPLLSQRSLLQYLLQLQPAPSSRFLAAIASAVDVGEEAEKAVASRFVEESLEQLEEPVFLDETKDFLIKLSSHFIYDRLRQKSVQMRESGQDEGRCWQLARCLLSASSSGQPINLASSILSSTANLVEQLDFYLREEASVAGAWTDLNSEKSQPEKSLRDLLHSLSSTSLFHGSLLESELDEETKEAIGSSLSTALAIVSLVRSSILFYSDDEIEKDEKDLAAALRQCVEEGRSALLTRSSLQECTAQWLQRQKLFEPTCSSSHSGSPSTPSSLLPPSPSSLPTIRGFRTQLCNGVNPHRILRNIMCFVNEDGSNNSLRSIFTLGSDEAVLELSLLAMLTGRLCLLGEETLEGSPADFLLCGLVAALNSCDEDEMAEKSEGTSGLRWGEPRRRLLASSALLLASSVLDCPPAAIADEWTSFFLPTISSISIRWWAELCASRGAEHTTLARLLSLFIAKLRKKPWEGRDASGWDASRLDHSLDQLGIAPAMQTLLLNSADIVCRDNSPSSSILSAFAVFKWSAPLACEEKEGMAAWLARCLSSAVTGSAAPLAVLCLVTSAVDSLESEEEERASLCEAVSSVVLSALPAAVSRAQQSSRWNDPIAYQSDPSPLDNHVLEGWPCRLLYRTFSLMPSTVRLWYTGLPKAASTVLFKFVCDNMSRMLVADEVSAVRSAQLGKSFANNDERSLNVRASGSEVECEYAVEETRMHLRAVLPNGWPLLPIQVDVQGAVVGVDTSRKWMLQLSAKLHRNSPLWSALRSWLEAAERRVDSAEACTICMAIVAPGNKQLPRAKCRQCKNKFHSSCLYKWFDSSNQSTCPLCRTDFTAVP